MACRRTWKPGTMTKTRLRPGPKPGHGGAPRKAINWRELDKLCAVQCSMEEIASWFELDADTLTARIRETYCQTFPEYFAQKRGKGKIALRRRQLQVAMGTKNVPPNPTMLIWLGKQYLGQSDRMEAGITARRPILIDAACDELPEPDGKDGATA